ncbi:hypothetical protein AVEN_228756-1 [Araneus ventricosus]|uniref:Uncharacterized protein n=1 Tax=Araneus ventricosus TaxID=182803 RepID=A0A4Y2GK80_ARAVE|nr:hypothetical protein AVEN_228756-1 [Araneus ventricosus]
MVKSIHPFIYGPWSFSQLSLQIPASSFRYLRIRVKGRRSPLHNFCHLTSSFHFIKPSARKCSTSVENLLLNKLSRIKPSKLISFLTDNEDLIKQQPDATNSSDSDPDLSPSPRPQTDGPRPSGGSIPRTLINPPASF